jgi:ribose 5-phosphate isomerase A
MSDAGSRADQKRRAGERAAETVPDGAVVGLGTGSTAAHAIAALGRAVDAGLAITGIPTSYQSRARAVEAGIPLTSLDTVETVDIAIDGADEVADGDLVKGGGAAHAREKIVDAAAERFVVVVDPSKEADVLSHDVPVEVLPDARTTAMAAIRDLGGEPSLRAATAKDGPVVTDNGNVVLDCDFGEIQAPGDLGAEIAQIPGVLEHGLFVGLADEVIVGETAGTRTEHYG